MASPTLGALSGLIADTAVPSNVFQSYDPDRVPRIAQAAAYRDRTYYCIAALVVVVSIFNWSSRLYQLSRKAPPSSSSLHTSRGTISVKRLPAAFMNTFRALAFRKTIKIGTTYTLNLSEFVLTAAYITLVFTWSMVNSTNLEGVPYDPKYWSNAAGSIVATQLSLVAALGMKNNLLSFLTGVSFDKMNDLHRMTSRVLAVLIWVHASGRLKVGLFKADFAEAWLRCGILAATSLSVLSIVSLRPIRERSYEVFLLVHFLLVFIALLGAYFHTQGGSEFGVYVWPAFVVWGADRLLRAIRIITFNFGYFSFKGSPEFDAHVDVFSPRFLRIRLRRPAHFHWAPGQSVYLTLPAISTFPLEAHPFTISTIEGPNNLFDEVASLDEKDSTSSPPSTIKEQRESAAAMKDLVFFVRVRTGFSKRLLRAAGNDQTFKAFLDGPYSTPPLLRGFDTVILIAGGSGAAFTLPLLLDLIHRSTKDGSGPQRVVFMWAIRDIGHVEWISDSLVPAMKKLPTSITLDVRLFVTATKSQAQSQDDSSSGGGSEVKIGGHTKSHLRLLDSPLVSVQQGRPNIDAFVKEEINRAHGDISVNVCGGIGLANTVRSSLSSARFLEVLRGGPSVVLHVETA